MTDPGEGETVGDGEGVTVGDGVVVGGVGSGVGGGGVGSGVGSGTTIVRSPGRVAWIRYPATPVPELSRWPSGPETITVEPDSSAPSARASGPTTTRVGPDPSSTSTANPSARASAAPSTVPRTRTREPSSASVTSPVARSIASGSDSSGPAAIAASLVLNVRCEYRLAIVPVIVTVVPAGQMATALASR